MKNTVEDFMRIQTQRIHKNSINMIPGRAVNCPTQLNQLLEFCYTLIYMKATTENVYVFCPFVYTDTEFLKMY